MTSFQMRVRLTLLAVTLAAAGQEFHLLSRQKNERQVLAVQHDRLQGQLGRLQTATSTAKNDLDQANQELSQLQVESQSANSERELAIRSWLKQSRFFQQLFIQRPEQAIPELQLLTSLDWLRLSHETKTETELEIRQGLAAIRSAGTAKFVQQLSTALKKYTDAHEGTLPTSPSELAPYLDPGVDLVILTHYEMLASGKVSDQMPGLYVVAQSGPIDATYDSRSYIAVPPYGMSIGPWRLDNLWTAQQDARAAYFKDTGIRNPKSVNNFASYISSPAIKEIVLGLEEYRQSHPSKSWPERASQFLPLLTSAEAKAKAAKIWPEELAP